MEHTSNNPFMLPIEILENIFSQIPLAELLLTHCHVCKEWAEVILNPSFMPWKKLYVNYKLQSGALISAILIDPAKKAERQTHMQILSTLAEKHEMKHNKYELASSKLFLVSCIRMMGSIFNSPEDYETVCRRLESHTLYKMAKDYLQWLPELLIPDRRNTWHLVSAMILFANSVWEIDSVLKLLLSGTSLFIAKDVVDAFYCLAVFLLYTHREYQLPIKYHFMLYYVIYLFENSQQAQMLSTSSIKHKGQQSMQSFLSTPNKRLTPEQARIVNYDIKPRDIVKIVAFAGTGKTTTLLELCKARPHLRFLLVVYNKSVQEYWQKKFPRNTTVRTAHSLAFANCGRRFAAIKKLESNLRPMKISDLLSNRENSGNKFRRAKLVKNTLDKFINSSDMLLTLAHVPTDESGKRVDNDYRLKILLPDAEEIWREMTQCNAKQKMAITHDGYLKLWQLQKPRIQGFDIILIDEAQDMNPAIFDILIRQEAAKIVVGDPYQQIYQFRGAVNALQGLESTVTFYLTQSFRFGPEISYAAQCILGGLLKVKNYTLVGAKKKDCANADPRVDKPRTQRVYLSRTNSAIYRIAVEMCTDSNYQSKRLTFAGGVDGYNFQDIIDIYKLRQFEKGFGTKESLEIKNKLIARFESVASLAEFAQTVEDHELTNKILMFKHSGDSTMRHVNLLRKRCSSDPKTADITFSTIHKSKGLEWDWVILVDDMMPDGILSVLLDSEKHDEFNLLYVSVTRAKKYLTINSRVLETYSFCIEKLEYLVPVSEMPQDAKCLECGSAVDTKSILSSIITKVSTLHLFSAVLSGGFICNRCSLQTVFMPPTITRFPISKPTVPDYGRLFRRVVLFGLDVPTVSPRSVEGWENYATSPLTFHTNSIAISNDSPDEEPEIIELE